MILFTDFYSIGTDIFVRRDDLEERSDLVVLPQENHKIGDTPAGAYEEIFGVNCGFKNDGSISEEMFHILSGM
jgi:hypothetical protein